MERTAVGYLPRRWQRALAACTLGIVVSVPLCTPLFFSRPRELFRVVWRDVGRSSVGSEEALAEGEEVPRPG